MKKITGIVIASILAIGFFCTFLYTSCTKAKCGGVTCQNSSTCVANVCICPKGYSGSSCGLGWDDGAIGTYNCYRSNCIPGVTDTLHWQSAVTKDGTNSGYTIDISNFDNANRTLVGIMDSTGRITVSPAAGTYGINASGTYANGRITLHFTTSSSGGIGYTCDMTMVKI